MDINFILSELNNAEQLLENLFNDSIDPTEAQLEQMLVIQKKIDELRANALNNNDNTIKKKKKSLKRLFYG